MKAKFTFLMLIILSIPTSIFAQRTGYNCTNGISLEIRERINYPSYEIPDGTKINTIPGKNGGTGTAEDPFMITSNEDLVEIATRIIEGTEAQGSIFPNGNTGYAGQHFKLANDIEIDELVQIGNTVNIFHGNLDGDGHAIKGIKGEFVDSGGLFSYITGTIKNLSLYGSLKGGYYTGALAAMAFETSHISNVHNYCDITADGQFTGGIVAATWGTLIGCTNNADITSTSDFVGGVSADTYNDTYDCVNTGNITGTTSTGGVIGYCTNNNVARLHNAGNIYGSTTFTGGVIGFVDNYREPDVINRELINTGEVMTGSASVIGQLWIEAGVEGHTEDCFYNSQNSKLQGYAPGIHAEWVQPKTVLEMIGDGLAESLTSWTFNEGMFPMPAPVAESEIAICAATPAYFFNEDGNVNMYNALNKDFTVNIENGAAWSTDSDIITIEEGVVTLVNTGDCILTLNIGNASKYYNLTVSQPDNVNEIATLSNNIYPNPANNSITIDNQDVKNVKIYNVKGQCMIDVNMNGSSTIDVSALEVGFYILRAEYNDNSIATSNISITR